MSAFYDQASLVVVPSGYKTSKVYAQKPLTTDGQLTFSRASTATRVNSAGLIETVSSNVPRLDYLGSTCPKLLLEPSRTNLVPNGLAYLSATGVAYNTAVSGSPMAGVNCARITKNEAAGTLRYANQQCSNSVLTGSTGYVLSSFFKYDGYNVTTSMEFNNSGQWGGISWNQVINISSTGVTLGTSTSCTSTVENWGSGWYRVNVRITTGASPSGSLITYLMRLPSTLSTGQGFLHALPQFEAGAYATSYIPTTTAAVTRLADACSKTGISSLIGQTEGTIYWEGSVAGTTSTIKRIVSLSDGTTNNGIYVQNAASGTVIQYVILVGGTVQFVINVSLAFTFGQQFKLAAAYKANDFVLYINGLQVGSSTSGSVPATSKFAFDRGNDTTAHEGNVAKALLFKTRLTNAQLAELTTL